MSEPFSDGGGGAIVRIRVTPRSRRPGLGEVRAGALSVGVSAAPERGKATAEAVELVASRLGIARSRIRVLSGRTSRDKRLLISGVFPSDLRKRLAPAAPREGSGTG